MNMLLIQAKASKKGGILVIDATGEMHPCLEPDELWDILTKLGMNEQGAAQPEGEIQPVPEALFIRVKARRDTLVIIDPLAEMHHCTDAHGLWDTIADLIENDDMPKATTAVLATQNHGKLEPHENVQVVTEEESHNPSEVREVIEEMVGDAAAELGSALFSRLRGLSHRGAAPKPGSRAPKRRVGRGDIY